MSTTPNLNLALQVRDAPDWDIPNNANFTLIDGIVGGGVIAQVLTSNGPGTPPTYQNLTPGSGTVTSVGLTLPGEFAVADSPITTAGTLAATKVNQAPNSVWAGPASGGSAPPAFRSLAAADIPFTLPNFTAPPAWWSSGDGSPFSYEPATTGLFGTGTANQVKFWMIRIPYLISVSKLSTAIANAEPTASKIAGYAVYSADGQTKLISWDNIDTSTLGPHNLTLGSPVQLGAGVYCVGMSNANSANAASTGGAYSTRGSSTPGDPWNNNGTVRAGVGSNVMSGGVMPGSLGTLSVTSFLQVNLAVVTMEA